MGWSPLNMNMVGRSRSPTTSSEYGSSAGTWYALIIPLGCLPHGVQSCVLARGEGWPGTRRALLEPVLCPVGLGLLRTVLCSSSEAFPHRTSAICSLKPGLKSQRQFWMGAEIWTVGFTSRHASSASSPASRRSNAAADEAGSMQPACSCHSRCPLQHLATQGLPRTLLPEG